MAGADSWLLLARTLKVEAPKIRRGLLQLQPEFPARAAFAAPPHQHGFTRNLVRQIDEPQPLSHSEPPRHYSKAAFRANIDPVAFRAQALLPVGPLGRVFVGRQLNFQAKDKQTQ